MGFAPILMDFPFVDEGFNLIMIGILYKGQFLFCGYQRRIFMNGLLSP